MSSFTPGPWAYSRDPGDDWGWVRDPRGCVVATARNPDAGELADYRRSKTDPYEANARLIAAAPDLYEALRDAVSDAVDANPGWLAMARAALAKAEAQS